MPWIRFRNQHVTKGRLLTFIVACGFAITTWFHVTPNHLAAYSTSAHAADSKDDDKLDDFSGPRVLTGPVGSKIESSRWRSISAELVSNNPPPWIKLDTAALSRNFQTLKRVVEKSALGSRVHKLMRHRVPVISTTDWRLHSPNGLLRSIESIQRTLLLGSDGYPVPNVAHFILPFRDPSLQFHHMVSILSCLHVMRPQILMLWYAPGRMIRGKWWSQLRVNLSSSEWENRIVMATRPFPEVIYSNLVTKEEHLSDIVRMEALLVFGGAYFDIDVIVLKPLEPLRVYPFTIGRERKRDLCNGAILSAPNSTFLAMWHTAYQVFNGSTWAEHSVRVPHRIHQRFPELCHVEEESMDRPNWTPQELDLIYGIGKQKGWNWRAKNYVVHLWFRWYNNYHDMQTIKKLDSMYGEICRFILYGTTKIM